MESTDRLAREFSVPCIQKPCRSTCKSTNISKSDSAFIHKQLKLDHGILNGFEQPYNGCLLEESWTQCYD